MHLPNRAATPVLFMATRPAGLNKAKHCRDFLTKGQEEQYRKRAHTPSRQNGQNQSDECQRDCRMLLALPPAPDQCRRGSALCQADQRKTTMSRPSGVNTC